MRSVRALPLATILFLSSACTRAPEQRASDAAERPGSADAGLGEPAGGQTARYEIQPDTLERFIRFQERVLPLHAQMMGELARAARGDAGSASAAAIRRHAEAQDRIRRELGLTERDVEELEVIVGEVISRRATLAATDAEETLREMESLAARLPAEQRAEFDATLAPLRGQLEASRSLAAEKERYGAENVGRILAREAELTQQWNRAIAIFSGSPDPARAPADAGAAGRESDGARR